MTYSKQGDKYIFKEKRENKWTVMLPVKGRQKRIGSYKTKEDAINVRDKYLTEK